MNSTDSQSGAAPAPAPALAPGPAKSGAGKKVLIGCGAGCTLMMALVFGLLAYVVWQFESGAWPDSAVTAGEDLPEFVEELLLENQILEPGEQILYFYSMALTDYLEDGNVLTDRRVISYAMDEVKLNVSSATFEEILLIEPEYTEDFFEDTTLMVETEDEYIYLFLSTEDGQDRAFIEELERRIAQED